MSTNSPFDVRIVNPLERPTSSDFNIAQAVERTTAQKVAGLALDMSNQDNPDVSVAGFYGRGFEVVATTGLTVRISPGVGFLWARSFTPTLNINGVPGVDIYNTAEARPFVMDAPGLDITIPTPPAAGLFRRDAIAIRKLAAASLATQISTDRFNPTQQVFAPQLAYKTLTWTLNAVEVPVIPAGPSTAEAEILYVKGATATYDGPNDFFNYGVPEIPSGYELLAVLNIEGGATEITDGYICDFRKLFFPERVLTFPVQLTAGAAPVVPPEVPMPGTALAFSPPYLPGGLTQPVIRCTEPTVVNKYSLYFRGFYNAKKIAVSLNVGGVTANTAEITCVATIGDSYIPNSGVPVDPMFIPYLSANQVTALADPTITQPTVNWAVGQPYCRIDFRLGVVDINPPAGVYYTSTTFTTSGETTRTLTGTVTISY